MMRRVAPNMNRSLRTCLGDRTVDLIAGSTVQFRRLDNGGSSILVVPPGDVTSDSSGNDRVFIETNCKMLLRFESY